MVAAIVVHLPFTTVPAGIPVLARLWRGKGTAAPTELARDMLLVLRAAFPGVKIHCVGDAACHSPILKDLPAGVSWMCRLAKNAALVDLGAQTVIVPAAWPAARRDHWRLFTSCRAVEEQVLLAACNAVGDQGGTALGGHSRVVDPWGELLAEAGEEEGITSCDVDPGVVARTRAEFPVLVDRRPLPQRPADLADAITAGRQQPVRR
ncbi:MAG: nitrilase-related carbon-nitrogen hydrolase [Streptosporangiaceae bacterium]